MRCTHLYSLREKCQRATEASNVVASVTQQSRQRVPQSRTEYSTEITRRPHEFRRHDELMTSGGAYRNRQIIVYQQQPSSLVQARP